MTDAGQTPSSSDANTDVVIAVPKRRRSLPFRIVRSLLAVVLIIYVAVGFVLYFAQAWMVYPGAFIHAKDGVTIPPPDCELIALRIADGTGISAMYGPALNDDGRTVRIDAGARPTILFFYGNGDCIGTSLDIFHRLRMLGVNVMIPEYPGYRMSAGTPSEARFYEAADAAYDWLVSQHGVSASSIVVMGRSIGGAPAIDLASRKPVGGLITVSAFSSLDEMAKRVVQYYPTSLVLKSHFRNEDKIAQVSCPILLMHGDLDQFVPPFMMKRLADKTGGRGEQVVLHGCDHNDVFDQSGQAVSDAIAAFLKDHGLMPASRLNALRADATLPAHQLHMPIAHR